MTNPTKDDTVRARYLMYTDPDRTKAYRLDIENDGRNPRFWLNGDPVRPSQEAINAALGAFIAMDTALLNIAANSEQIDVVEEP